MFDALKKGLAAPLAGMGISFSSSLFGLAGSLVLGFLDLQASQAQNRFYTDLEDWLTALPAAEAAISRRCPDLSAASAADARQDRGVGRSEPAQATTRRWPISPKASRGWCSTCAPSSR